MKNNADPGAAEVFYLEGICSRADDVLRLATLLTLDREAASAVVHKAFEVLSKRIRLNQDSESISADLVKATWDAFKVIRSAAPTPVSLATTKLIPMMIVALSVLTEDERGALGAVDFIGLPVEESARQLGMTAVDIRRHLAQARKKVCTASFPG